MSQAPYEVYARQLALKKNGCPLWRPDPHDEPAVEIADVGYVEKGKFIRLFNASMAIGGEANCEDVPRNYTPLQVGKISKDTLSAGFPMMSKNITQLGGQLAVLGGGGGGGFSFECEKGQGAVLVLGDHADVQDALDKKSFLQYIRSNYQTWLDFAEKRLITLSDLVLVTGCDKTSAWACATIWGRSMKISLKILAGQGGVLQGSVGIWASWDECQSVDAHSGPQVTVRPTQDLQSSNTTKSIDAPALTTNDITSRGNIFMHFYYMLIALILYHLLYIFRSDFHEDVFKDTIDSPSGQAETETLSDSGKIQPCPQDINCTKPTHDRPALDPSSTNLPAETKLSPLRTQCIFVRGFKLLDRKTWRRKLRMKEYYDGFDYFEPKSGSDSSGRGSSSSSPRGPASNGSGRSGLGGSFGSDSSGNSEGHSRRIGRCDEDSGRLQESSRVTEHDRTSVTPDDTRLASAEEDVLQVEDMGLCFQLNRDKEISPLDVILDFILENSAAELALIHDDDLKDLILHTEDLGRLEDWIREANPKIYVENQVGMLHNTYQVSISLHEEFNLEEKNSQIGILTAPSTYNLNAILSGEKSESDDSDKDVPTIRVIERSPPKAAQTSNEDINDELELPFGQSQLSPPAPTLPNLFSSLDLGWSNRDSTIVSTPHNPQTSELGSGCSPSPILTSVGFSDDVPEETDISSLTPNGVFIPPKLGASILAPPSPLPELLLDSALPTMTRDKLEAELMHYRRRLRELEYSSDPLRLRIAELEKADKVRNVRYELGEFALELPMPAEQWPAPPDWEARTAARLQRFCATNRMGNALCQWHNSRRERRAFPPRMAPPNTLNCGCTYAEALFEESLARNQVGGLYPGEAVRMDPELRNPLLKLLQDRYRYRDGDFERQPNGTWREGDDAQSWNQRISERNPPLLDSDKLSDRFRKIRSQFGHDNAPSWARDQQPHNKCQPPSSNSSESCDRLPKAYLALNTTTHTTHYASRRVHSTSGSKASVNGYQDQTRYNVPI